MHFMLLILQRGNGSSILENPWLFHIELMHSNYTFFRITSSFIVISKNCKLKLISGSVTSWLTVISDLRDRTSLSDFGQLGGRDFYRPQSASFHFHSSPLTFFICFLTCFNLVVPMRKCSGEHSCMSSTLYIVILNGTCTF